MPAEELAVIVLAAGKGTRMKSKLIKVLHPLMGQPMLAHVLNSARYLNPSKIIVVVGHQSDLVMEAVKVTGVEFAIQEEQLGTGHAVASARGALADFEGTIMILSGDVPLLSPQTMSDFLAAHHSSQVPISVLTVELPYPGAYGRVIRDREGFLLKIVEARDCTAKERAVKEINSGIYATDSRLLFEAVDRLTPENDQREYYLTDVVADLRSRDLLAAAIICPDAEEVLGINDRVELAASIAYLKARINETWMRAGVTMIDPASNYIETSVKLSPDVTLWPGTSLLGKTMVASGVTIGPDCLIEDSSIGTGAIIKKGSVLSRAEIQVGAEIGPLAVIQQ